MLNRSATKYDCVFRLNQAGISVNDAFALRRISMTLHRWHELECGYGNAYSAWTVVRGDWARAYICTQCGHKSGGAGNCEKCGDVAPVRTESFAHDDDGKPYLERHYYTHGKGKDSVTYTPLADRQRGALKRLDKIMARYPGFAYYVQTDPRGCALYILRPQDQNGLPFGATDFSSCYTRGIAVFK